MVKNYILDTNIVLSDAKNIFRFEDNNVVLTGTTICEINKKKTAGGEVGYQARECARYLDELRKNGNLSKGVDLHNNGKLFVYYNHTPVVPQSMSGFDMTDPDNQIIATCLQHQQAYKGMQTILVTADKLMRVNAEIAGVKVQGYKNEEVESSGYTGHVELEIPEDMILDYAESGEITDFNHNDMQFYENEFITVKGPNPDMGTKILGVYQNDNLKALPNQFMYNGFAPANDMQRYALWALKNPDIPLVIMDGRAGTGKTLLSLSAGLDQTYEGMSRGDGYYNRILISRPNSAANDPAFGYLPGGLDDKMAPLLLPYMDNLETLLSGAGKVKEDREQVQIQIEDMFASGILEICALSYIRGRSLNSSYMICDEAQNATQSLIRDVVSRCGKHSKIVLSGDPEQCDAPHLDTRNNGLTFAKETMKGSKLCAIITFDATNSVRSSLAKEAVQRMKLK